MITTDRSPAEASIGEVAPWYPIVSVAALVLCVMTYSQLLVGIHVATEWLVR